MFEPGRGAAELRPSGDRLGVGRTQTAQIPFFDFEGKVSAHHPGFGQGDFESLKGDHAGGGVAQRISQQAALPGGPLAGDQVAVSIDPWFAAGAGDLAVGAAPASGRANAGPKADFQGVQAIDGSNASRLTNRREFGLRRFEPNRIRPDGFQQRHVSGFAATPSRDQGSS